MTLRARHGASLDTGIGPVVVETLPVDELPRGVPAAQQTRPAKPHRGRITTSARAREIGALGGKAKGGTTRLSRECSIEPSAPELAPYLRAAQHFRRMHCQQLAKSVGGGVCGAGPASLVASAGLQLAFSRHAFDHGRAALGSKLANDSRQNLLAAHELCAREAKARPTKYAWDVGAEPDEPSDDAGELDPTDDANGQPGAATGVRS